MPHVDAEAHRRNDQDGELHLHEVARGPECPSHLSDSREGHALHHYCAAVCWMQIRTSLPSTHALLSPSRRAARGSARRRAPHRRARAGIEFTLPQVLSYAFPSELTAASRRRDHRMGAQPGRRIATSGSRRRPPHWRARRITRTTRTTARSSRLVSSRPDGSTVVYVRGGDHDANWDAEGGLQPDPATSAAQPSVQIWSVARRGAAHAEAARRRRRARALAARRSRRVHRRITRSGSCRSTARRRRSRLFFARGAAANRRRGRRTVERSPSSPTAAITASSASSPRTRRRSAISRRPRRATTRRAGRPTARASRSCASRGAAARRSRCSTCTRSPWAIWIGATPRPARGHRVVAEPARRSRLVSRHRRRREPALGRRRPARLPADHRRLAAPLLDRRQRAATPLLLTPGSFMAEYVSTEPGRPLPRLQRERRHATPTTSIAATSSACRWIAPRREALTPATGLEWTPVVTGDGRTVAFIGATAQRPPLPAVMPLAGGAPRGIAARARAAATFPSAELVVAASRSSSRRPTALEVHGQLFERAGGAGAAARASSSSTAARRGRCCSAGTTWTTTRNAYAVNQYLASHGFVVLVGELPARHRLRPRRSTIRRTRGRGARRSIRT